MAEVPVNVMILRSKIIMQPQPLPKASFMAEVPIIVMILHSKIIMQPQPLPKAIFMAVVPAIVVYLRSLSHICEACHIFAKQMCD